MADSTPEIRLFLSEGSPVVTVEKEGGFYNSGSSTLTDLESAIWALILSSGGGRSEVRLWLHSSISSITSVDPLQKRHIFTSFLNSTPANPRLSSHLFLLMFRKRPELAGGVLAAKSHLLRSFFRSDRVRVQHWFSAARGGLELGKGAKALSHFAFVNRDTCWGELEWRGKHGQSPAMVATKPHYFLDLDILPTVSNFLRHVPEFWSSPEFSDSLRDGRILSTDTLFFSDLLSRLLRSDDESSPVWEAVSRFLTDEHFSSLCRHLLPALAEEELREFLRMIRRFLRPGREQAEGRSFWLEEALSRCGEDVPEMEELMLVEAVVNEGRQLLRIVKEGEEEGEEVGRRAAAAAATASGVVGVMKGMGVLAWSLHYLMREKVRTGTEWETLFLLNGIGYRRGEEIKRRKKKRKEGTGSWRLSVDDYSIEWEAADLPEMLSKHCFRTWMKWGSAER